LANHLTFNSTGSQAYKNFIIFYDCSPIKETRYEYLMFTYWFWIDMLVYFLIPCCTMFISFFIICFQVKKYNQKYSQYLTNQSYKANARIYLKKIRLNKQMLLRLSIVNAYFFVSILPHFILNIFMNGGGAFDKNVNYLLKIFVEILFFSNNALNFFFYGISSQKFRQELFRILMMKTNTKKKKKKKKKRFND